MMKRIFFSVPNVPPSSPPVALSKESSPALDVAAYGECEELRCAYLEDHPLSKWLVMGVMSQL